MTHIHDSKPNTTKVAVALAGLNGIGYDISSNELKMREGLLGMEKKISCI